jgi:hypothetical protein
MVTRGLVVACLLGGLVSAVAFPRLACGDVLNPGDPVTIGSPTSFSGVGGTNASGGAFTALAAFEAAIGGTNNGATAPQASGFRIINWDGVALDGTDFDGNTVVVVANKVVAIPRNRFEARGALFEEVYAVSNDSFTSVNPGASGLIPAFSPSNTFAMFNDNTIGLDFILPAMPPAAPAPAATRGFGAIFRNPQIANTTSIEYFNGSQSLGKFFVPSSASAGTAAFLGVLFASPIVTGVQLTCGTDTLFNFNGTTFTAGGTNSPPTHNLVATDDFAYAEPAAPANVLAGITATAGTPFGGIVTTFRDSNPSTTAHAFTALIDWGDSHLGPGTIQANAAGGFDVSGSNTYTEAGTFPIAVDVESFAGDELKIATSANVTAASTTTTTTILPCAGDTLGAIGCLLAELPLAACAGQSLPGPVVKLSGHAHSLVDSASAAQGKKQKKFIGKLVKTLGHVIAAVGQSKTLTGSCPSALASLFADAHTRAQAVLEGP